LRVLCSLCVWAPGALDVQPTASQLELETQETSASWLVRVCR
jgi:hypothetical protein